MLWKNYFRLAREQLLLNATVARATSIQEATYGDAILALTLPSREFFHIGRSLTQSKNFRNTLTVPGVRYFLFS